MITNGYIYIDVETENKCGHKATRVLTIWDGTKDIQGLRERFIARALKIDCMDCKIEAKKKELEL